MNEYYIRELSLEEIKQASELIWKSFYYSHNKSFSMDAMECFRNMTSVPVLQYEVLYGGAIVKGCFLDGELLGASVGRAQHLILLFVKIFHQRKGIGGGLLDEFILRNRGKAVTVHSTPSAVGFYSAFGFRSIGPEVSKDGLCYVPMKRDEL